MKDADIVMAGASEHDHGALVVDALIKGDYGYNLNADKDPARACRPFDRDAQGWVYSIGAGCLLLDDLEHAHNRGLRGMQKL